MPHRNLPLSDCVAAPASPELGLIRRCQGWLNADTILVLLQANHAMSQGLESDGQAPAPAPHPGLNIAGTGLRAITAWRSGRRI